MSRARSVLSTCLLLAAAARAEKPSGQPLFNDAHFHLTNYVQEGPTPERMLELMGTAVPRSTLFGIPLQQQWSHRVSGDFAPTYYLETDAPLYYYSFTDAFIAESWRRLPKEQRARFDPMITGFNPTDMYAADHVRRALETYPGVFSGIGEFTIHKEFVSSKVAGEVASLVDPALDRLLSFAEEVGLVVILHSDVAMPFAKREPSNVYLDQLRALLRRHPGTTIVWAHVGLGRVVQPVARHAAMVEEMLADPAFGHVVFDLSWDEVAKYLVASPETIQLTGSLLSRYPDRFLFGTDTVAPVDAAHHRAPFEQYAPLWSAVSPAVSEKVRLRNYERVFDEGRRRVRAWEQSHRR